MADKLPWGLKATQQGSLTKLSQDKQKGFLAGATKKSRFQKEKEEKLAKQKQAEEEAAKIYEQFVASFETEDDADTKTFVRGSSYVPRGARESSEKPESGSVYRLSSRKKEPSEMEKMMAEMQAAKEQEKPPEKKKSGRQIDAFLEELKNKQEGKASTPSASRGRLFDEPPLKQGSYDDGDPETTNLYVGNLAPTVTEETLQDSFRRFGEIYSVKIMWPRTEEEKARRRNCGFVSFYRRADAEDAKLHMHDSDLEGYKMIIGWGKAIKKLSNIVPNSDMPPPEGPVDLEPPPEILENMRQQQQEEKPQAAPVEEKKPESRGKWDQTPPSIIEREMTDEDDKVEIKIPDDPDVDHLICRTARYVAKDGALLEQRIREKEIDNPEFKFLFDYESDQGRYYRWRVFSLLMGDKEYSWRVKPFQLTVGSAFWVPPPVPEKPREDDEEKERREKRERERSRRDRRSRSRERDRGRDKDHREKRPEKYLTGRQLEKARDRERGRDSRNHLPDADHDDFLDLLRNLTISREKIKEAMGFALDFADASEEVVEAIKDSLVVLETAMPVKLARLYLLSDILHNSTAPVRNASTYRTLLQKCLPEIFESFNALFRSPSLGRITAKQLEEKVMQVLKVWEDWSIYPPLYITGLEATFRRKPTDLHDEDLSGISEDSLDQAELERKARAAGLSVAGSSLDLLRRLNYLSNYVKLKTAGKTTGSAVMDVEEETPPGSESGARAGGGATSSTSMAASLVAGAYASGSGSEDEDLDGKPMDTTTPRSARQGPYSSDEDVDGRPLDEDDEDLDGRPLDTAATGASRKGANEDSDSDSDSDGSYKRRRRQREAEEQEEENREADNDQVPAIKWTEEEEDERRAMLRKLETRLIEMRDELEERVGPEEAEKKCQKKRKETIEVWEQETLEKRRRKERMKSSGDSQSSGGGSKKRSRSRSRSRSPGDRDRRSRRKRSRSRSRSPRRSRSRSPYRRR